MPIPEGPYGFVAMQPRPVTLKRIHWGIGQVGGKGKGVGIAFGEDDSVARLFAASPELLFHLRRTLEQLSIVARVYQLTEGDDEVTRQLVADAEALIAKVEAGK